MTDVAYSPPHAAAPDIKPLPQALTPEANALVDRLNQNNEEMVRHQKEYAVAIGADLSQNDEKVRGINATLEAAVAEIAALDSELKREQARSAALAGAGAVADGADPDDPRNVEEWQLALDCWIRNNDSLTDDGRTALALGNKWQKVMEETPVSIQASASWNPQAAVQAGGLSTMFGPGAGVWARPEYDSEITKLIVEFSPIRMFARVTPVSGAEFVGVVRNHNRDEIEQVREGTAGTQQTQLDRYDERRIRPYLYYARPGLTPEMLEDSVIDLEAEVLSDVGVDFAEQEATVFTVGSGANEPMGYATDTEVEGVTSVGSGTLEHQDFLDLALSLRPFYRQNGAYAFSTTAFRLAILAEDSQNRRLWQPAMQEGLPSLYSGWPYFESVNQAAVAASSKSVFFADWKQFYRIIDRRGIKITRDETRPEIVILTHTRRYGGRTWKTEAGKALTTKA